jgi:hypothetical protein
VTAGRMVALGGRERAADRDRVRLWAARMRVVSIRPLPGSFFSLIGAPVDAPHNRGS